MRMFLYKFVGIVVELLSRKAFDFLAHILTLIFDEVHEVGKGVPPLNNDAIILPDLYIRRGAVQ